MRQFEPLDSIFKGRHFEREIIILCVRWYLSFKLSFRDLKRAISVAHSTILRWVQHFTPQFEKRWQRFARSVGGSWRMDETYIKVRGQWAYLYRAVDKAGAHGGLLSQFESRCERCQSISPQSQELNARPNENHVGRLPGFASRSARDKGGR